ncbi:MAG: lysophospholipid acyltransferase family protein [Candidatus Eiseniibacteriota bacterium]
MRGKLRTTKRILFHAAVRGLEIWARLLPRRPAMHCFATLGSAVRFIDRPAVARSLRHLEIAQVGADARERHRIVREMFRAIGRNLVDLFRLPRIGAEGFARIVSFEGLEHLDRALARGRGVVILSAHLGNWEVLAAALAARGYPMTIIARRIFDERSDRLLNRWRRACGIRVVTRQEGLYPAVRALRRGEIVGTLADQDTGGPSVFADFFGRPARTPEGPFRIARRTGAALVPLWIHLGRDGVHRVQVLPEVPEPTTAGGAREDAERWHRILEEAVRLHPEQWVWYHRRWKTAPPAGDPSARKISKERSYPSRFQRSREVVSVR